MFHSLSLVPSEINPHCLTGVDIHAKPTNLLDFTQTNGQNTGLYCLVNLSSSCYFDLTECQMVAIRWLERTQGHLTKPFVN